MKEEKKERKIEMTKFDRDEQREFWSEFLEKVCQAFPAFDKYIQDPMNKIFTYSYRREYKTFNMEQYNYSKPIPIQEVFSSEFLEFLNEEMNCRFFHGSYRACFIIDCPLGHDWVLKFSTSYDTEREDMNNKEIDCCDVEEELYMEANRCGIAKFFAETHCIGSLTVNGHSTCRMFVARRYDTDEDYCNSCSQDYDKNLNSFEGYYDFNDCFSDEGIADAFILSYDHEQLMELSNFIYERHINDLHNGNIGFDINFRPVIIDYSLI